MNSMSAREHQRLDNESPEERAARLNSMSAREHHRLDNESPEERAARLNSMSAREHHRLDNESPEERAARLNSMSARQHQRLDNESPEERAARLERLRQNTNDSGPETHLPLLEQPAVKGKMLKFHQEISTLEMPICSTCMEKFPGLKVNSESSVCLRCSRDKINPKLYSSENNMIPGPVPVELQVIKIIITQVRAAEYIYIIKMSRHISKY